MVNGARWVLKAAAPKSDSGSSIWFKWKVLVMGAEQEEEREVRRKLGWGRIRREVNEEEKKRKKRKTIRKKKRNKSKKKRKRRKGHRRK